LRDLLTGLGRTRSMRSFFVLAGLHPSEGESPNVKPQTAPMPEEELKAEKSPSHWLHLILLDAKGNSP